MYLYYICTLLFITLTQCSDFLLTNDSNDVVHFYARFNASEDYIVTDCFAGRASYKFKRNQAITVIIYSDKAGSTIVRCDVFNSYHYPNRSATSKELMNDIYKTEIYISSIGDKHFDLKCYYGQHFHQRWCRTHITITDIEKDDGFYNLIGHTMIDIVRNYHEDKNDNRSEIPTRDVNYYDNSSLSITCKSEWTFFTEDYVIYTITRKAENGTILEEGTENVESLAYFIKSLDESYNNNELYCIVSLTTSKSKKNFAKVKLKYQSPGSTEFNVISTKQVVASVIGVLTLFVITVTLCSYLWYEVETAKRKKRVQKTVRDRLSTSGIYENPYDVVYGNKEQKDRLQVQRVIENDLSVEVSTRPPPPPVDTIPYKTPSTRARAPTPPNDGSLIAPSDMYLLQIDSDGYEIPIEDRAKYIRNTEET